MLKSCRVAACRVRFSCAGRADCRDVPDRSSTGPHPPCRAARRCELAGLLRALSLRAAHHPALRACRGLVPALARALAPGAPGWAELKAAARRVLVNLGEVPDTDRPLLTYTKQQLGALLEGQGIQVGGAAAGRGAAWHCGWRLCMQRSRSMAGTAALSSSAPGPLLHLLSAHLPLLNLTPCSPTALWSAA